MSYTPTFFVKINNKFYPTQSIRPAAPAGSQINVVRPPTLHYMDPSTNTYVPLCGMPLYNSAKSSAGT